MELFYSMFRCIGIKNLCSSAYVMDSCWLYCEINRKEERK